MQSSSLKLTGSTGSSRSHAVLIASQVALTVVLLTAAGASVKTLYSLVHTKLGYDPRNVVSMYVPLSDDAATACGKTRELLRPNPAEDFQYAGCGFGSHRYDFLPPYRKQ